MKKILLGLTLLASMSTFAGDITLNQSSLTFSNVEEDTIVTCGEQGDFNIGIYDPCNINGSLEVCETTRFAYLDKGDSTVVKPDETVFVKCN